MTDLLTATSFRNLTAFAVSLGLLSCLSSVAEAQWAGKWLHVGDLQHQYSEVGHASEELFPGDPYWMYPGIYPGQNNSRNDALWVSARNVESADGRDFPLRISHIGPRIPGVTEAFRAEQRLIAKFEPPEVTVDGLLTFLRPVVVDEVDENIPADRLLQTTFNLSVGITGELRAYQWSNEYHDHYHILEYTFTNTGRMEEGVGEPHVVQDLDDVYFTFMHRNAPSGQMGAWYNDGGSVWGQFTMNDAVGDGFEDYPWSLSEYYDTDFRGSISWMGHAPAREGYNGIGGPAVRADWWNPIQADSVGRLSTALHVGTLTLHADHSALDDGDDRAQPRVMTYIDSDDPVLGANDHNNATAMQQERTFIEGGADGRQRSVPTHARRVRSDGQYWLQREDVSLGRPGGFQPVDGYGPYDIPHGESVRIVWARVIGALSEEAALHIGREYKRLGYNDNAIIEYDANGDGVISADEQMTKNEWAILATADSLFKSFQQVREHFQTGYGSIPEPPRPPQRFDVNSGPDRINLSWEPYPGHEPAGGWEIYRAQRRFEGIPVPDSRSGYQLIAELSPNEREYPDTQVERGQSYFYYIQAVGDINNDGTAMTPTGVRLRSSRHYTQTYEPAFLRRPPGQTIDAVRVVPNPYNIAADPDVRWDVQDRLAFLDVPGDATIQIFTQLGELVTTIEHSDGSGDVFWNMTTNARQLVVSGIYIAYIRDNVTGEHVFRKFVIIR